MSVKNEDDLEGEILTSFLNPRLLSGLVRPDVLVALVLVLLTCGAVYLTTRLWSIEDWLSIYGGGKDQVLG